MRRRPDRPGGVVLKSGVKVLGDAVIAADGAYSPDRESQEEQERSGLAIADGLHRPAAVASGRAVRRGLARCGQTGLGAGISKALESGLAAGDFAIAALANGGPDDFTNYAQQMEAAWGKEYRRGRYMHKLIGHSKVAEYGLKLMDTVRFRDVLLKSLYAKAQGRQHTHK